MACCRAADHHSKQVQVATTPKMITVGPIASRGSSGFADRPSKAAKRVISTTKMPRATNQNFGPRETPLKVEQ
jgi:hypothetical protein